MMATRPEMRIGIAIKGMLRVQGTNTNEPSIQPFVVGVDYRAQKHF